MNSKKFLGGEKNLSYVNFCLRLDTAATPLLCHIFIWPISINKKTNSKSPRSHFIFTDSNYEIYLDVKTFFVNKNRKLKHFSGSNKISEKTVRLFNSHQSWARLSIVKAWLPYELKNLIFKDLSINYTEFWMQINLWCF